MIDYLGYMILEDQHIILSFYIMKIIISKKYVMKPVIKHME